VKLVHGPWPNMHAAAKLGRQPRGQRAPLGVEVESTGAIRAKRCTIEAIPRIAAASAHEHTAVCAAQSYAARANALEHALCGLVNGMHGRTAALTTALSIDVVVAVPHHLPVCALQPQLLHGSVVELLAVWELRARVKSVARRPQLLSTFLKLK
jgi:hypothetical protein